MSPDQTSNIDFQLERSLTSPDSPRSSQVTVDIAGATHCGHVRENNEDHYLALKFQRSLDTICTNLEVEFLDASFNEAAYGLLVADGMGGLEAGETASRMALCKLVELVVNTPDWIMKFNRRQDENTVLQRITQRFRQVDQALREQAEHDNTAGGMGTTLTVAVSLGSTLMIGHVGDSRAYLMRNKSLHQITKDHTLAQALVDAGIANPDDDTTKALHHVLTAALGATDEQTDPQVLRFQLMNDDQVLLCTDGLTETISTEIISSVLSGASSSKAACDALINLALSSGGIDNVTVVLARYLFPPVEAQSK
jgi:Serine/threonine protein phosphatase